MGLEFPAASLQSGLVCKGLAAAEMSLRGIAGTAGRWQPCFTCAHRPRADRPGLVVRAGGKGTVCHRRCLRHGTRSAQHAQEPLPRQGGAVPQDGPGGWRGAAQVHPQRQLLRSVRPRGGGEERLRGAGCRRVSPVMGHCKCWVQRRGGFAADQQTRRSELPHLLGAFGDQPISDPAFTLPSCLASPLARSPLPPPAHGWQRSTESRRCVLVCLQISSGNASFPLPYLLNKQFLSCPPYYFYLSSLCDLLCSLLFIFPSCLIFLFLSFISIYLHSSLDLALKLLFPPFLKEVVNQLV